MAMRNAKNDADRALEQSMDATAELADVIERAQVVLLRARQTNGALEGESRRIDGKAPVTA